MLFLRLAVILLTSASLFSVSCNNQRKDTLFENLPVSKTNISFENNLLENENLNILYYLYYYNGGGVATGDINNDGLPDIYFTANSKSNNKLYLNKGDFKFEDITAAAGVAGKADWASGVTMVDINADGFLDIYVTVSSQHHGLTGANELYLNNKDGTFTETAEKYGLNFSGMGTQAAFFDYDRDGDLDCYLLNHSQKPNSNIVDTAARRKYNPLSGDKLYRNDLSAAGRFTDVSAEAGIYQSALGYGLGIAIADMNHDGWDDIYVGNDFHENDYYYLNNGNGTFTESGDKAFRHYSRFSMGNDINDFNNDGQPDIVTVDMLPPDEKVLKTYGSDENPDTYKFKLTYHGYQYQYSRNALQVNNGQGVSFSETALLSGISATDWSWAPLFADFDNDGNKDLFISSGIVKRPVDLDYIRFVSDLVAKMDLKDTKKYDKEAIDKMPDGASHPYFYKGSGSLKFEDVSDEWGTADIKGYFNGASYADLNNDGNLDVVINSLNARSLVLKNNAPPKYTAELHFKGPDQNRFGIGTKVWLFSKGKMQYQQLHLSRGFQSSCEPIMHFGIDSILTIDSMLVVWPDQKYQMIKNIPPKGDLQMEYRHAGGTFQYNDFFPPVQPLLNDITKEVNVNWKHKENNFFDQNKQYLIPHQLSSMGPRLAVGDINLDGLDDMYVCGASGQSGQLLLQQASGTFRSIDTAIFSMAKASEETAAIFFDANNDKYPDLYVVSGGNEFNNGSAELEDHFYLNDGRGHFKLSVGSIPSLTRNKSTVSSSDFDKDGDNDLFVGGLADARMYGIAQPSYLLVNDGQGRFSQAGNNIIALDSLGMVTASGFIDIDKDGWDDLIVTGEWMPMKIFSNKEGKFSLKEIPASTGLWQSLLPTDINGDGHIDILAGNWGHNSKLYAGKQSPLKLYVKDFDNNGSIEQIMTYTIDGKEYTFLAKDELERALPVLKKAYLNYSDVAGETVQYMFYDLFNNYKELKAEKLGTSVFINNGKGGFSITALPEQFQLSPVYSFLPLGEPLNGFMVAGNFYGTVPYEGRYDGLQPSFLTYDKAGGNYLFNGMLPSVDGEIRDARRIRTAGGKEMIVLARNNESLLFFRNNIQ